MERKLGLYVTLGNDGSLKRTLVSISGETELEATTLNDEVILFSELIFDFYAFIVDRIPLHIWSRRTETGRIPSICAYLSSYRIRCRI